MEYVSGGTLLTMLKYLVKITEEEVRSLIAQVGEGLGHLHGLGIIHRDLRCENILITLTGCVKISNLDISRGRTPAFDLIFKLNACRLFGSRSRRRPPTVVQNPELDGT